MTTRVQSLPGGIYIANSSDPTSGDLKDITTAHSLEVGDIAWVRSEETWYVCKTVDSSASTWELAVGLVHPEPPEVPDPPDPADFRAEIIQKHSQTQVTSNAGNYGWVDVPVLTYTVNDLEVGGSYLFQFTGTFWSNCYQNGVAIALFNNGTFLAHTERHLINDSQWGGMPSEMSTHSVLTYNGGTITLCFKNIATSNHSNPFGAGYFHNGLLSATRIKDLADVTTPI